MSVSIHVVLGKVQPAFYQGSTYDWPEGVYLPMDGESGAFDAVVRKGKDCYAVCERYINPNQGHVSNRYVRAPEGTYVCIMEDDAIKRVIRSK